MRRNILVVVVGVLILSGTGCNGPSGGNWLIGTWVLHQPDPPVAGQDTDANGCNTKFEFASDYTKRWEGAQLFGPYQVRYEVASDKQTIFTHGEGYDITYNKVDAHTMNMREVGGLCTYTRQ